MSAHTRAHPQQGFSLIEVMVAVVILSFGLLALASLQAGLFRSGAESKARANATTIAQQLIEDAKTFAYLAPFTDASGSAYTGATYQSLDTASFANATVGGVTYTICRQVRRYVYDQGTKRFATNIATPPATCTGSAAGAVDPGVPEFKEVRAIVSWSGDNGQAKSVVLTDTIAGVAPADGIQVVKTPNSPSRGPEVWIEPPNKDNPQVVPIAIGDDQSAASSNPKPQQFVRDVSAATLFSVLTFTGSKDGPEVLLNRKLDIAAVSCVCAKDGTSSTTKPAFLPTVWNGKQRAYLNPQTAPAGTPIGRSVASNSDAEITSMCTVCCRDHHEKTSATYQKVDPWRELTDAEKSADEHYGYPISGNGFELASLRPVGTATSDQYIDACQLIRVDGRRRVAIDAQQVNLLVTPITGTSYDVPTFVTNYSDYVKQAVENGIDTLPTGYPSPTARFPSVTVPASSTLRSSSSIALGDSASKKLIAFGLYVDYLSNDTLQAYECASQPLTQTGSCAGLGGRNPLETIPFYAVNVANLGEWRSAKPATVTVQNAIYDNAGLVSSDGGITFANAAADNRVIPVTLTMGNSNSGLASTFPVDPDDEVPANRKSDYQNFSRTGGDTGIKADITINIRVEIADSTNLSKYNFTQANSSGITCEGRFQVGCTISYKTTAPASVSIRIGNYNSTAADGSVIDRRICVSDSQPAVTTAVDSGSGSLAEITVLTLPTTQTSIGLAVVDSASCPVGYH